MGKREREPGLGGQHDRPCLPLQPSLGSLLSNSSFNPGSASGGFPGGQGELRAIRWEPGCQRIYLSFWGFFRDVPRGREILLGGASIDVPRGTLCKPREGMGVVKNKHIEGIHRRLLEEVTPKLRLPDV